MAVHDLAALWDAHCRFEFETRDVDATMATMVAEPYVNHIPTMTGGVGFDKLRDFYANHFIGVNPPDMEMVPVASPGAGLTPGDAISVEPSGIPVGETAEPVPIPSGEVAPRLGVGLAMPLTCARAALQTKSAAGIAAISDNLVGKRARMELLRRIGPQDCRVYVLLSFQTPSDGLLLKVFGPSHLHN